MIENLGQYKNGKRENYMQQKLSNGENREKVKPRKERKYLTDE